MKSYTRTSEPATEPVSTAEAIAFLRAASTTEETTLIAYLIKVAREVVEDFTGRVLIQSDWLLASDCWPTVIDRSPLTEIESVIYWPADGGDQVTLSEDDYHVITAVIPGQIKLVTAGPALADRPDAVQIAFTAGVATAEEVRATLRHCVQLLVAHLYELRTPVNVGNIVNELPYSLKHLLESQRLGGWSA